jgi:hypothetical protein
LFRPEAILRRRSSDNRLYLEFVSDKYEIVILGEKIPIQLGFFQRGRKMTVVALCEEGFLLSSVHGHAVTLPINKVVTVTFRDGDFEVMNQRCEDDVYSISSGGDEREAWKEIQL